MMTDPFHVGLIPAIETYPLRQAVLRPNLTLDEVAMDGDDDPTSFHVGARCVSTGGILTIMTVMRNPIPNTNTIAWRIRGMASHPDSRGAGCGGAVLGFGINHAWSQQRDTIWCNARKVAYGFYERYGFRLASDEFDIPGIGPHKVMMIDPA